VIAALTEEALTNEEILINETSVASNLVGRGERSSSKNPHSIIAKNEDTWQILHEIMHGCDKEILERGDVTTSVYDSLFIIREVATRGQILLPGRAARAKMPHYQQLDEAWKNLKRSIENRQKFAFRYFFFQVMCLMMLDYSHLSIVGRKQRKQRKHK
jgi:hypothetical protein